jgi:hypothetical protein
MMRVVSQIQAFYPWNDLILHSGSISILPIARGRIIFNPETFYPDTFCGLNIHFQIIPDHYTFL